MPRIVVVTGACGAIGRAIARRFQNGGDFVVAIDKDGARLSRLVEAGELDAERLLLVKADVTDEDASEMWVADLVARFGSVDVLVNHAGGSSTTLLANTDATAWRADVELNLHSAYYVSSAVLPSMLERGNGVIVNIGSVNGLGTYGDPGYSAAKAGLISYTRTLATEFGRRGVRAHVVCPGTVRTDAWTNILASNPGFYEDVVKLYSIGRICEPEEVAGPVHFLCGPDASGMNGTTLHVDGGLSAGIPHIVNIFSNTD